MVKRDWMATKEGNLQEKIKRVLKILPTTLDDPSESMSCCIENTKLGNCNLPKGKGNLEIKIPRNFSPWEKMGCLDFEDREREWAMREEEEIAWQWQQF